MAPYRQQYQVNAEKNGHPVARRLAKAGAWLTGLSALAGATWVGAQTSNRLRSTEIAPVSEQSAEPVAQTVTHGVDYLFQQAQDTLVFTGCAATVIGLVTGFTTYSLRARRERHIAKRWHETADWQSSRIKLARFVARQEGPCILPDDPVRITYPVPEAAMFDTTVKLPVQLPTQRPPADDDTIRLTQYA